VDDEEVVGPRWAMSQDAEGRQTRRALEIVDPSYREWPGSGSEVVAGYATLRWRQQNLVVVRVAGVCSDEPARTIKCSNRLSSVYIHETEFPVACNYSFVEERYWDSWKDSKVQIHPKVPVPGHIVR